MSDNIKFDADKAPKPVGLYPHARKVGNLLFLSGHQPHPHYSKLTPYLHHTLQKRHHLQQFSWCKAIGFSHIHRGTLLGAVESIAYLLAEPVVLGWPPTMVAKVFQALPRRHQTPYLQALRLAARIMRKSKLLVGGFHCIQDRSAIHQCLLDISYHAVHIAGQSLIST